MFLQIYSIFDKKVGAYKPPFHAVHVAEATRSMQMVLEDSKSLLAKFPGDYALYLLGTMDTANGSIFAPATGTPSFVIEVSQLLPQPGGVQ